MNRCRPAIALGLAVPALVLGGCSGEPEPRIAPSGVVLAGDVVRIDVSGSLPGRDPVATVRAWVEAQNDALTTGDTGATSKVLSARAVRGVLTA